MRFEAKHKYFKKIGQRVASFKNIAKTLATRHQRLSCYNLAGGDSVFPQDGTVTGQGIYYLYLKINRAIKCRISNFVATSLGADPLPYSNLWPGKVFTHK